MSARTGASELHEREVDGEEDRAGALLSRLLHAP